MRRGVPVRRVGKHLVTTVYDLLLAQFGVGRPGLPGRVADRPTTTPRSRTPRPGRSSSPACPRRPRRGSPGSSPRTPRSPSGRSMIIMGAGTNHWFHSDTIYRAFLTLTTLTGCQGVNGGGWAHYVGQEKCRPVTGWIDAGLGAGLGAAAAADDPDRVLVPAHRPVALRPDDARRVRLAARARAGSPGRRRPTSSRSRRGWAGCRPTRPSTATRSTWPTRPAAAGKEPGEHVVDGLRDGSLRFACEDPDAPENFPRVLTIWRANLLGSSAKGNEYFLKHLLGTDSRCARRRRRRRPGRRTWSGGTRPRPASWTCCWRWTSG